MGWSGGAQHNLGAAPSCAATGVDQAGSIRALVALHVDHGVIPSARAVRKPGQVGRCRWDGRRGSAHSMPCAWQAATMVGWSAATCAASLAQGGALCHARPWGRQRGRPTACWAGGLTPGGRDQDGVGHVSLLRAEGRAWEPGAGCRLQPRLRFPASPGYTVTNRKPSLSAHINSRFEPDAGAGLCRPGKQAVR